MWVALPLVILCIPIFFFQDASFDEGVKDVDVVVHTASPLSGSDHPPDVDPNGM